MPKSVCKVGGLIEEETLQFLQHENDIETYSLYIKNIDCNIIQYTFPDQYFLIMAVSLYEDEICYYMIYILKEQILYLCKLYHFRVSSVSKNNKQCPEIYSNNFIVINVDIDPPLVQNLGLIAYALNLVVLSQKYCVVIS